MHERGMPQAVVPAPLALPMQELLARLLGELRQRPIKQILLVGVTRSVGTSFIARHWVPQLVPAFGNVLLIEVLPDTGDDDDLATEAPAALAERSSVVTIKMSQDRCVGLAVGGAGKMPPDWLSRFGLIVWDVPPLTTAPVALVLAREMDAIVLVAQSHRTRRLVALHTAQRLQECGGRLLGVILNHAPNFIPAWIYRLL